MRLGWDEIKRRAKAFSEENKDAHYEKGETQTFYNEFFEIFGIKRKQVAIYEQRVKLLSKKHGFIDLFWPRTLLVEQKSSRLDLRKAQGQALDYVEGVHPTEQPRYVLSCDFQNWVLLELETGKEWEFHLQDLHKHITAFDFMLGRKVTFETQADVTIKAAELMGKLHDALEASGYTGHDLEQFLVRTLFCLFADNTGIFQPKDIFLQFLENDTTPDGSDMGSKLSELFDILDTPEGQRLAGTAAELDAFPYVNGALFTGRLRIPKFDTDMRAALIDACRHDWSAVSPAIFGSLFQSVMDAKQRRAKGAHYTSEDNILKVIGPLFLNDLRAELATIIARRTGRNKALAQFQDKLTRLTFFDPACGCGNFLVIAYREIRRLELEALKAQYGDQQIDAALLSRVTVDQFYGIEYEEFPARIAEVAMWMMDHIANNELNQAFRLNYARIPLKDSAHILHGDALEADWADLLPPEKCSYIMGNPPFLGQSHQSKTQRQQMVSAIGAHSGKAGSLDFVGAWFLKAGAYVKMHRRIRFAYVATNSIVQGEQVAQLWPILFEKYGLEIIFAHRPFVWGSEAKGKAHVHVVIIGLAHRENEPSEKRLYSYPDPKADPIETLHKGLTAYLFDARRLDDRHLVVVERSRPLSDVPKVLYGSKPVDGGHLILDADERREIIRTSPSAKQFIRRLIGAQDFLNGGKRWCLWLVDTPPKATRSNPEIRNRIANVRKFRTKSKKSATRKAAERPSEFAEIRQPKNSYVVIPMHTSETRTHVPFGFFKPSNIVHNSCTCVPGAGLFDFGIISSLMHMAWLSHVGGRIKSDFRYSNTLVYNTFPWPDASPAKRAKVEALAQAVLDARGAHPTSSLADLYDPDIMPAGLRRAHNALDKAVDRLYRATTFETNRDRVEHLFGRYESLVNPLERLGAAKNKRVNRKAKAKGKTNG